MTQHPLFLKDQSRRVKKKEKQKVVSGDIFKDKGSLSRCIVTTICKQTWQRGRLGETEFRVDLRNYSVMFSEGSVIMSAVE